MAGRVRQLIDELVTLRGGTVVEPFVRAHLMMKGIDPDAHHADSPDDMYAIDKLRQMIRDFTQK